MSVRNSDATGTTLMKRLIGIITMIILELMSKWASKIARNFVQMMKIVDHLNGLGNTAVGGRLENVNMNLTPQ